MLYKDLLIALFEREYIVTTTKFSQDVVPLSDLKINPGRIVKQVAETHRPTLLTHRGRGVAVIQDLGDYEDAVEECAFMRAVVQGLTDIEEGRTVGIAEAKKQLGLK